MQKSLLFFTVILSICISYGFCQVDLSYKGGENYVLVERTDLLRYDNNKYTGLLSREVQSYISYEGVDKDGSASYDGSFFVVEETKHNKRSVRLGIRTSIDSAFLITKDGTLVMKEDNGYPSFRSFPSYTKKKISIGDSWVAKGERAVDPLNNGTVTRMPILVEYIYERDDVYNGREVYVLKAKWATRYGISYVDGDGDPDLQKATGSHNATIIISKEQGNAIVIKDTVDETFIYSTGNQVRLKGTISLFTRYPPSYNVNDVVASAKSQSVEIVHGSGSGKTEKSGSTGAFDDGLNNGSDTLLEENDRGLTLVMRNLHFKSNSAELLAGEETRLDKIAQILKSAPDAQYLVEGHTADTGNPSGEKKLSLERAKTIANELSKRGIKAEQFICKGYGANKPAASNSTPEGMAANRRVEITILKGNINTCVEN